MHICRLKVSLSVRLTIIHMYVYVICIWQVYSNIVRFICGMKRESSDVSLLTLKRLSIHTVPKFGNFSFNKPFVRPKSCIGKDPHVVVKQSSGNHHQADRLTLYQPGGADYAHHLVASPHFLERCYSTALIIYLLNHI